MNTLIVLTAATVLAIVYVYSLARAEIRRQERRRQYRADGHKG